MIKPIDPIPRRRRRRIPIQENLTGRISSVLDEAIIKKFRADYSGYPFEKTPDNKYHLHIGSLELVVYMDGYNIVTKLEHVPDVDAETGLTTLLQNDQLFSHQESPLKKRQATINSYRRLFKRISGDSNSFVYVPQPQIKKALSKKRAQVVDTIIDYMIKPLLLLLPGPSRHLEKMY